MKLQKWWGCTNMDMSQYLEIFIEEAKEYVQSLNENLLQLEHDPESMNILNEVFRVAHTLKGMAGTMGFTRMQKLTHNMENVLSEIRNGKIRASSDLLDVLFKCLDALENYVDEIINTGNEGTAEYENIIKDLNAILLGRPKEASPVAAPRVEKAPESQKEYKNESSVQSNIILSDFEINAAGRAKAQGLNVFSITIHLNKACVLKSARAFIIFRTLETYAEIIKSQPRVEDIEDERFDFDFSVVIISKESKELFLKELNSIAEVDEVLLTDMDVPVIPTTSTPEQYDIVEPKPTQNTTKSSQTEVEEDDGQGKAKPKAGKTVRVDIDRLDKLMNLVSELIIIKTRLEGIEGRSVNQNYNDAVESLERITTNLHDAVMKVRMVPVERVFNRFPRMIRDLSRKLNKDIELHMSGEDTELDRIVIDEIGDPLIHLLRNAADHGLETPEQRRQEGKPELGNIYLRAYQDGNNVVIEVEEDGKGVDGTKIKNKAIEKGIISADTAANMTEQDMIELLFRPSFSTAEAITDVSGRGVGLDVVKNKIETLGGIIEVKSVLGKGSKFTVRLPMTLTIIQALMVKLGKEKYAIPLNTIQSIEDVKNTDIKFVQKQEVILLRNAVIPIIRLDEVLDVSKQSNAKDTITVVIVKKGEKQAGFVVDSLIGQQEIVIRSLGKYLSGIKNITGATILGDGEVALILDTNALL